MLRTLIEIYSWVVLLAVILSWTQLPRDNPFVRAVNAVTEPVLAPIRRVLPNFGGWDFSPVVLFLLLRLLTRML